MISERELALDAVKNLKILTRRDDITIKSSDNHYMTPMSALLK